MASTMLRLHRASALWSSQLPFLSPSAFSRLPNQRHAMMSALSHSRPDAPIPSTSAASSSAAPDTPPIVLPSVTPSVKHLSPEPASPQVAARPPPAPKAERPRPTIRASKAAILVTPVAVQRLRNLLKGPTPKLIRIGVRNKGCAGLSYHLEYVDQPARFDEVVEQDGVRVVIDSKALFSIIGSEMDWTEDALSARFTFKNPNVKDACGCGESFTVG